MIERRRTVRRLLALGFLVAIFAEIGSHAALDNSSGSENSNAWSTCFFLHKTYPSADCPHKHRPFGPQSAAMDEMSHHWTLMPEFNLPLLSFSHENPVIECVPKMIVTRAVSPPFVPPKQV